LTGEQPSLVRAVGPVANRLCPTGEQPSLTSGPVETEFQGRLGCLYDARRRRRRRRGPA